MNLNGRRVGLRSWLSDLRGPSGARRRPNSFRPRFEDLECRAMMTASPATIPVTFNLPDDLPGDGGLYVAIFGTLSEDYTNSQGATLTSGTQVYFEFSSSTGTAGDYAAVAGLTTLVAQELTGSSATINLPNVEIAAGQIVMGVENSPLLPVSGGAVTSPASTNNADNIFALFEFDIAGSVLDIDASAVDQVGFPFTISTVPPGAKPAQDGVGMTPTREKLFEMYETYIQNLGADAAGFVDSLTYGNGNRILAPQNVLNNVHGGPVQQAAQYSQGGTLPITSPGTQIWYWVTATSASGETTYNNPQIAVPYNDSVNSQNVPMATVVLNWSAFQNATGYKVYRSYTSDIADAQLVGTVSGGSTTTFSDSGLTGSTATPPSNDYTFMALNSYFNTAIDDFFAHYTEAAGNEFSLLRDGHTFTGYVQTDYQFGGTGTEYTALVLNSPDFAGQDFVILQPYFSTNTSLANAPAPPAWLQNATQSPAGMVLANDGVFNTGGEQPGADAGVLSDIQNSIVSAFNRGIASNFELRPDDWANSPLLQSATATAGGTLAADTYYYVLTGANLKAGSQSEYNESVVSLEYMATTTPGNGSVLLTWLPLDESVYTHYRIYRTTTSGSGYQLLDTIENGNSPPTTTYTDNGSKQTTNTAPHVYYAPGTASNWYAGFLHQNSTNDPVNGVSIHGLAYGFGYDDQNGTSTNFTTTITAGTTVTINVNPWGTATPTELEKIEVLTNLKSTRVGDPVQLQFKALTANGDAYTGGGNVTVILQGKKNQSYTVALDEQTGIGTLNVSNLKKGLYTFKIIAPDQVTTTSEAFSVLSKKAARQLLAAADTMNSILSESANKKTLKLLRKLGFSF